MLQTTQVYNEGATAYHLGVLRVSNPYSFKIGWVNRFKGKFWYMGYDRAEQDASMEKLS